MYLHVYRHRNLEVTRWNIHEGTMVGQSFCDKSLLNYRKPNLEAKAATRALMISTFLSHLLYI